MKANIAALTAKNEATYSVDPTPTAAANAMLAFNISVDPLEVEAEERDLVLPWYGDQGEFIGATFARCKFSTELAGGGAAGTAPKWGPLAKGCAMSETTNAGVSVTYAPISAAEVSTALRFYIDGRMHNFLGSMGTGKIVFPARKRPRIDWDFLGLYATPTDVSMITPTLTGWVKAVPVNKVNTTPLTLHSYAIKSENVELDFGVMNEYSNRPNLEKVRLADRKSKFAATFEDELVATTDWWTIVKNGTTGALALTHGLTAGNIITLAAANVQLTQPKLSRAGGTAMIGVGGRVLPSSAGNDEFSIAVT